MSFSLRRRNLACFYCGSRSAQKQNGKIRQWKCEHCEAVNYLDKHGQISDPPPPPTPKASSSLRFAHVPDRAVSPPRYASDNIFCETCLKNQHIVKENLSSYLPPEDSPRYEEYLSSYDSYRAKLEQRYPQVCARCAPKVRERIKKTAKEAQADHLRRMMERTRQNDVQRKSKREKMTSFALALGGLAWCLSALVEACWHLMVVSRAAERVDAELSPNPLSEFQTAAAPARCWSQMRDNRLLDSACMYTLEAWMPVTLCVSLLSSWWNNKLRQRYIQLRGAGKFVGLENYYFLQYSILIFRLFFWWILSKDSPEGMDMDILRLFHIMPFTFVILSIYLSFFGLEISTKPRISFQIREDLLPQAPTNDPTNVAFDSPRLANGSATPKAQRGFPISKLATPAKQSPHHQFTNTLAVYPEEPEHDPDAMDWTPTMKSPAQFNPNPRPQPPLVSTEPSPFHGTLPAAPIPPSHRLRKPPAEQPGAFRRASETQRETFFANMTGWRKGPASIASTTDVGTDDGTEVDDEDDDDRRPRPRTRGAARRREMDMKAPRFFPREAQADTGLEAIFDEVFTIRDEREGEEGGDGGFGGDDEGGADDDVVDIAEAEGAVNGGEVGRSKASILLAGAVPVAILGGIGGLLVKAWG